MISPHVRRQRLAHELNSLRRARGYSTARMASVIGSTRQHVSRLLNGHLAPDPDEIAALLRHFDVPADQLEDLLTIARQAATIGWWEPLAETMGPRQAMYAGLEAGARRIDEYQMTLIPGLLQIPSFTEARCRAERLAHRLPFDCLSAVEARLLRQRAVHRDAGPTYEVVLDEFAIRRPAAPSDVVVSQLDHLVDVGHSSRATRIRVLRLAAGIEGDTIPMSSFSIYRYPDPDDPVVVAIEAETSDQVLADTPATAVYIELHRRLAEAAMPASDSLDFLATVAEEMRNGR
ncbi:helix-turn-helix transcriptional regulator [Hamadaea sp. NPDC050747]|uniref:helix-turn-helix domain-containing protein n=1 Tax=Hamadaea sp. NPDC050747 TaxID=3155789 RepID=UPI0033F7A8C2